jgi:hypothetical protein
MSCAEMLCGTPRETNLTQWRFRINSESTLNVEDAMNRERGRRRLMLRLPDIRHILADEPTETLGEMFEAYALAADALDRFRKQTPKQQSLVTEYSQLCRDIEQEVMIYCARR